MRIISFAWTTPALVAGCKSVTRREWDDAYARQFQPGDLVQAWDRSPRFGGKRVGTIRLLSVDKEPWRTTPDEDYVREGFAYLRDFPEGADYVLPLSWPEFEEWRDRDGECYVVRFELVEVLP